MYRKLVWCYLIVLTLLDISLNTKLSAHGKSHENGVSVHESLMEGISLQEWGKEAGGARAPAGALALSPAALALGAAALAEPHARAVTVTNVGNDTVHLASVAGSTPDFHASFFESKTLVPAANTTFSVVYLGRREGPVSALLYIHTSKGVLHYSVSAVGVASPWRVWPLVGVRVPLNATLEPLLTVYNPTDRAVQVSEVYSSGAWVGLALPDGGRSAPRAHWTLPPHAARALVRLRLRAPPAPQAAYIRIKGDMPGGALVVRVEAAPAPAGEFLDPLHLRLGVRGHRDPPDTFVLSAGSSAARALPLQAAARTRCAARAHHPPDPRDAPDSQLLTNGAEGAAGARVSLAREALGAHQALAHVGTLTLDYAAMWEHWERSGAAGEGGAGGAWCAGWAGVGRAAAPYSLRLLRGTVALHPRELHVVTAAGAGALAAHEVRAHNEFDVPVLVHRVSFPPELDELFHTESLAPLVVGGGRGAAVARLRLRAGGAARALHSRLTVHTNLSDYSLPVLLYDGRLHVEWEWPYTSADGSLSLGAVRVGARRRVRARLRNLGGAALCVVWAHAHMAGARLALPACRGARACCAAAGGALPAVLTVRARAAPGAQLGTLRLRTQHAHTTAPLSLRARRGDAIVPPLVLHDVAPYVWSEAPVVVVGAWGSLAAPLDVRQPARADRALRYVAGARAVRYRAERHCAPACATGLAGGAPGAAAWLARGALPAAHALPADRALLAERRALWRPRAASLPLAVDTALGALPARAAVRWAWPALAARGAGRAPPAAVGGAPAVLRVRVRNPAARALALQAVVAGEADACAGCEWAPAAFSLGGWRAVRGGARAWDPYVVLQPRAEIELTVHFAPHRPAQLAATLYLRNNLTILEAVPLMGRGAMPSFELAGREPNSTLALVIEVSTCGPVRRTVVVRNTGAAALRLREWRVGGAACLAGGFRLQPCAALALAPNESRALTLAFTPDWTRAHAPAELSVRAGAAPRATFRLLASAPARLLARCAAAAPRPPFEPALRALAGALALAALVAAVALAALDAERALRRHRAARAPLAPAPCPPLDLRALAHPDPAPPARLAPAPPAPSAPPPPPPRRRRAARPRAGALDAAGERRAFERWRAQVERRSRSSSGAAGARSASSSADSSPARAPPAPAPRYAPSSTGSDSSEAPRAPPPPAPRDAAPPPHAPEPEVRSEGAAGGEAPRARARSGSARSGARKERLARRRARAASPLAARASPPRAGGPRAPAVRWGASWSSVVARGAAPGPPSPAPAPPAPLAPIGSDVPRRAPSHSLFYYGGAPRDPPPPPPEPECEFAYRPLDPVWGAPVEPAAWLWGGAAVRPPPGFGAPRAARPYDPFHSLASIWTPAALDWRRQERADPADLRDEPAPPPSPAPPAAD